MARRLIDWPPGAYPLDQRIDGAWIERGLSAVLISPPGGGPLIDVLNGIGPSADSSIRSADAYGPAADYGGTRVTEYANNARHGLPNGGTVVVGYYVRTFSNYTGLVFKQQSSTASGTIEIRHNGQTSTELACLRSAAASGEYSGYSSLGASPTAGGHIAAIRFRSSSLSSDTPTIAQDGLLLSVSPFNVGSGAVSDGGNLRVGRRIDGAVQLDGGVRFVYIFQEPVDRPGLSDHDLRQLTSRAGHLAVFQSGSVWVPVSTSGAVAKSATLSLSAAVQQAISATATIGASVQVQSMTSTALIAAVRAEQSAQANLSAAVQQASAATGALQAAVQAGMSSSTGVDAAAQLARSATAALDFAVRADAASTASLSAQVQAGSTATSSVDAYVQSGSSLSVATSAAVLRAALATYGVDAGVQVQRSATAGMSAALQQAWAAAAVIDAVVLALRTAGLGLNAQVQAGTTAATALEAAVQGVATASASVQAAISQAASASLGLGAAVALQRSLAAAIDAAALERRAASAAISAYVLSGSDIYTRAPAALVIADVGRPRELILRAVRRALGAILKPND
jgi:hypothetical protein